ncbi:MAG: cation transporter [Spirochaetes bacterium]|nr:cation transporter [Spirochaetota bacterium]
MKDHHDHHGAPAHGHRHVHGDRRIGGGRLLPVILLNSAITAAEYVGGTLSGSLALISDAGHNLSDVLSLMLGYAGERVSEARPTARYSFGLKRFEVLIALVNSLSLLAIGIYILYESVMRFLSPRRIDTGVMLAVACIGLAGNLASMALIFRGRDSSLNMKAAFLHLLFDSLSSVGVVAAALLLMLTGQYWIDLAISVAIVVMIVASAADIIRQSLRIFLQGAPPEVDPEEVRRTLLSVRGVESVHGLHIWSISSSEAFLSAHVCLSGGDLRISGDELIRSINAVLLERFGISHTTVQIEETPLCSLSGSDCCR